MQTCRVAVDEVLWIAVALRGAVYSESVRQVGWLRAMYSIRCMTARPPASEQRWKLGAAAA